MLVRIFKRAAAVNKGGLKITPVLQVIVLIIQKAFQLFSLPSSLTYSIHLFQKLQVRLTLPPTTMKFSLSFAAVTLVAPAALAASLPACSSTSTLPCSCPSSTTYGQSVTFAVIGATATDVKALISDCPSTKIKFFPKRNCDSV